MARTDDTASPGPPRTGPAPVGDTRPGARRFEPGSWSCDEGLEAFELAVRFSGRRDRSLRVAGRTIELRFAGPALEDALLPAFAHLACEPAPTPDLAVACWDEISSGDSGPEPSAAAAHAGIDFVDGPTRIAWEPSRRTLSALDPSGRLGLLRFPSPDAIAGWERSAPARRVLHWWASDQGLQLVHAAAVGTSSGGVLLAGRGGSGKSTTALACVGTELGYAADDYCLVSPGGAPDGTPVVHALYGTGKADAASIARLPRLRDSFARSAMRIAGKTVIDVARDFPSSMVASFPLRAIVVPRLGTGAASLTPIAPAAALRALAPSTMMQLPGDRAGTLQRLAALVRTTPCFELALGTDPAAAVPLLECVARAEAPS